MLAADEPRRVEPGRIDHAHTVPFAKALDVYRDLLAGNRGTGWCRIRFPADALHLTPFRKPFRRIAGVWHRGPAKKRCA